MRESIYKCHAYIDLDKVWIIDEDLAVRLIAYMKVHCKLICLWGYIFNLDRFQKD